MGTTSTCSIVHTSIYWSSILKLCTLQVVAHGCGSTSISVSGMFCSLQDVAGKGASGVVAVFDLKHRAWEASVINPVMVIPGGLSLELPVAHPFARAHFVEATAVLIVGGWSM